MYTYEIDQDIVLFDNDNEFYGKVVEVQPNTILCKMGDEKPIEFDNGVVIPLNQVEDLFKTPDLIPSDVKLVLETFDENADTYKELARLVNEIRPLGYTFSYYLDAEPYWLRKI